MVDESEKEKEKGKSQKAKILHFSRWEDYPSERSHEEGMESEQEAFLEGSMRNIRQEDKETEGRNKLIQAMNNLANQISSAAKNFAEAVSELKSLRQEAIAPSEKYAEPVAGERRSSRPRKRVKHTTPKPPFSSRRQTRRAFKTKPTEPNKDSSVEKPMDVEDMA
ncbi:hypothetical protein JCGZ_27111 [Jatropha curcas]|uniref:Uncharacterized protein n=1 Tax=Jatropha curcas TaxID=180498 RepID=A0A067JIW0_JATCU|nr:hypothetical protein JCGZ_27111 [Jatropha curcas]